jgi:hypothetical protein
MVTPNGSKLPKIIPREGPSHARRVCYIQKGLSRAHLGNHEKVFSSIALTGTTLKSFAPQIRRKSALDHKPQNGELPRRSIF